MSLTIQDVKNFLRVDSDRTDEDAIVQSCMNAAEAYMVGAVSGYATYYADDAGFAAVADRTKLSLIAEMYTNRDARNDTRSNWSYMTQAMISQLQNYVKGAGA
jgi:uncharacterized phage protein (predicted DNA packaging)